MDDKENSPLFEVGEDRDIPILNMTNDQFIKAVNGLMSLDPARFAEQHRLADAMTGELPAPDLPMPQAQPVTDEDLSRFDDRLKQTLR